MSAFFLAFFVLLLEMIAMRMMQITTITAVIAMTIHIVSPPTTLCCMKSVKEAAVSKLIKFVIIIGFSLSWYNLNISH